ncbi:hypothetical protein DH2020_004192 [Rehmannia glutinosa]|uniref:Uncharacterized protein n=1 Tax=Rehmannia glutinosa TaxID=99300 RepID=A0ABR0XNT8_REHGL
MSRMMLRSNGKPPLARSPIRLRSRRKALQPTNTNTIHTPPGSLTKSHLPNNHTWDVEISELRPEYHTISCELRALAKMVHQELGAKDETTFGGAQKGPLVESAKKREARRFDSRRKTAVAVAAASTPMAERREARTPRYSLRSCTNKENKKPPLPVPIMNIERSVGVTERKVGVRRYRKA